MLICIIFLIIKILLNTIIMLLPSKNDDPDSPIWSVQTVAQFLRINRALWTINKESSEVKDKIDSSLSLKWVDDDFINDKID